MPDSVDDRPHDGGDRGASKRVWHSIGSRRSRAPRSEPPRQRAAARRRKPPRASAASNSARRAQGRAAGASSSRSLRRCADNAPPGERLAARDQVRRLSPAGAHRRAARSRCSPAAGSTGPTSSRSRRRGAARRCRSTSAVLDGEIVVDDENGVSDFSALQDDLSERPQRPVRLLRSSTCSISTATT